MLNTVTKDVSLKTGRELQASVVYSSQVNTVYNIFSNLIKGYPKGILTKDINNLLWNSLLNNDDLCKQILQKGCLKSCGDLFQEINTCCKGGSYTKLLYGINSGDYFIDKNIVNYDLNGNALRLGIANDRPSGLRTVFTLLFAEPSSINQMAIGGYSGPSSKLIALAKEQLPQQQQAFSGNTKKRGGKTHKHKRVHQHKTNKRRQNSKSKTINKPKSKTKKIHGRKNKKSRGRK